ncbi:MAG TPA: hypothetical protein VNT50_12590, partial [Microbacterium sp.]|nr:hypothetical protein [Microbacterium sp.]
MIAVRVFAPWIATLAFAVVVGLTGCTAADPDASALPPSPSVTAASPSPTISTTPSAAASLDPLLITTEGIGPYRLGGSFALALETLGRAERVPGEGEEPDRCPWFASGGSLEPLMTYVIADVIIENGASVATDVIGAVAVQDGGTGAGALPYTEAGVGLR